MKKREFLKTMGLASTGLLVSPMFACKAKKDLPHESSVLEVSPIQPLSAFEKFKLPPLDFATNALEPKIDTLTMEIHHVKHHGAYVDKLNAALNDAPFLNKYSSINEICENVTDKDTAIRNNAGGHYNHSHFWKWINPTGGKAMDGALMKGIIQTFGSYEAFINQFSEEAKIKFGSGWAWLSVDSDKKIYISSTSNQDNPLMKNLVERHGKPVLGIDVWEHAYYLNYQNKRMDYIQAFISLINWDVVGKMYTNAMF